MRKFLFVVLFVWMVAPAIADDVCPAGYTRGEYIVLEYIQTDGRQWLDTGIIQKSAPKITTTFKPLKFADTSYFGNLSTANGCVSFNVRIDNTAWFVRYGASVYGETLPSWKTGIAGFGNALKDGNFHELVLTDNQDVYLDGDIWATIGTVSADMWAQNTQSIYIGKGHNSAGSAQFTDFKIEEDGILKYHGIPARHSLTNKVGMYDLVSETFASSVTTAEFFAGPEKIGTTIQAKDVICTQCPSNTYKPNAGNEVCTACPSGTFSPIGSTSIDDCAKILRVNDYVVYMPMGKRTEHGLCTMLDGVKYCADVYERK